MRLLLREPFLHFLVLGATIFALSSLWSGDRDRYRIDVTPERVRGIATLYEKQYGVAPTAEQLQALVDSHVREEIFYREGMALELDRDDEIVRRRIAQKFEFIHQDLARVDPPDDSELEKYYRANIHKYSVPARVSFTHVYFSSDRDGDESTLTRARQALALLANSGRSRAPGVGDRFPDLYDYAVLGAAQISRIFGESAFTSALFSIPVQEWSGPFKSGLGWHLAYVSSREEPRDPPLSEVRDRVLADYLDDARKQRNEQAYENLMRQYTIVRIADE